MPNDFGAQLSQAGAVGLNASTSHDATKYYISMPVNKLELWFALEAERFRVGLSMLQCPLQGTISQMLCAVLKLFLLHCLRCVWKGTLSTLWYAGMSSMASC